MGQSDVLSVLSGKTELNNWKPVITETEQLNEAKITLTKSAIKTLKVLIPVLKRSAGKNGKIPFGAKIDDNAQKMITALKQGGDIKSSGKMSIADIANELLSDKFNFKEQLTEAKVTTDAPDKASKLLKGQSIKQLTKDFEVTNSKKLTIAVARVRGWIMDELESRNSKSFNAWMDTENPKLADLPSHFFKESQETDEELTESEEDLFGDLLIEAIKKSRNS